MTRRLPLPLTRSVRGRTTLSATLVVVLALAVGSAVLVTTLNHSLTRAADDQAQTRVLDLAAQAAAGELPATVRGIGDDSLAQVVGSDGRVLAASDSLVGAPAVSSFVPDGTGPVVRTMRNLPDDEESEDYRVWALRTDTPQGPAVVYVGPSLEQAQEATTQLVRTLFVGLPLLALGLAWLIWLVVGRALRPVEAIRHEVASMGARQLDRRVPVPDTEDEVAALARTMNQMLARLETAEARERAFLANASHDLQSPLTVFRTELEVALAHPDVADWSATARTLQAEGGRMESLVQELLYLATSAEPVNRPRPGLVDLDDVVQEEVTRARSSTAVGVGTRVTAAPVRGHRDDLARMVRNLLDNAVRHAVSRVEVTLVEDAGTVTLSVEDDGPGVPDEHRDRVFDRFFRGDPARDRSSPGTGLGLAIVRAVAEEHRGSVDLAGPAHFEVTLPTA